MRQVPVTNVHGQRLVTVAIKYPWPMYLNRGWRLHGFQVFNTSHGYQRSTVVSRRVSHGYGTSVTGQPLIFDNNHAYLTESCYGTSARFTSGTVIHDRYLAYLFTILDAGYYDQWSYMALGMVSITDLTHFFVPCRIMVHIYKSLDHVFDTACPIIFV